MNYYNVGKLLTEAGKHYGEEIIKKYSIQLTSELGKGYTSSRLRYMRRFFEIISKCPTMSDKLSYSHYCELIWIDNIEIINYYIEISGVWQQPQLGLLPKPLQHLTLLLIPLERSFQFE